ncbi:MAG: hypothetical protein MK132_17560 [Lentisphaerales bacterium]|nr:hypothetical protein [Lentisphaerales bacterium]
MSLAEEVSIDEVQEIISDNDPIANFAGVLKFIEEGTSFEALLNAFSVISARRFSRLPINNGGMLNTAPEGIRYAAALR